jgi:small subunit ribosomal protein S2
MPGIDLTEALVTTTAISVRELIEAGIHFGHRVSRWNPKMAPYIYGKRNLIHIIDVKETIKGIIRAKKFLTQIVADGKDVLFVATKRQAKAIVDREAVRCTMPFINERWLGGMLTNFRTIRERLKYLEQLEALEKSGEINSYSKKMISKINRERRKIGRNLNGVRTMNRLPGIVFVVDPRREDIAVREAKRLGIPTVALMDTDSDPDEVDLVIPGNDDAMRSIEMVLIQMADAVQEGLANRAARPMTAERMREVAPVEAVTARRPRGRKQSGGGGRGGPGGAGGGGGGGRGGREGGGRGGHGGKGRDEKRGPDPSQIAERGVARPVQKPVEAPAPAAPAPEAAAPEAAPSQPAQNQAPPQAPAAGEETK